MENLVITKVFFPEPGRSPMPELEDEWEYQRRDRDIQIETGKNMREWEDELVGQNIWEQPEGPPGWTAWSIILANGDVIAVFFRTKGLLQRKLSNCLADLNNYFSDKIPFSTQLVYHQMQLLIRDSMRRMCPCSRC